MSKRRRSNASTNTPTPFDYLDISSLGDVSLACIQGSVAKLKALLTSGYSCAESDNQGRVALHLAAEKGNLECCTLLIDHSENELNSQCYNGFTPLMMATKSNNADVVQFLVSNGARTNILDIEGSTCLNRAVDNNNTELFDYLLKYTDPNIGSFEAWTIAHTCAKIGQLHCLRILVNDKRSKFSPTEYGITPLHLACQEGHVDCVQLIIESGRNSIESQANDGVTPIFLAAQNNHVEIVKYMLDKEAKIDRVTDNGTVLHSAVIGGNEEILKLLLDRGADVEGAIGLTEVDSPLNQAIFNSNIDLVNVLLDHGANPLSCAPDPYSSTPLRVTFELVDLSGCADPEAMGILDLLIQNIPPNVIIDSVAKELKIVIQQSDNIKLMKYLLNNVGFGIIDWNIVSIIINKSRVKCLSYLISSNFRFIELHMRIKLQDYFKESTAGHDYKHVIYRALYDQLQFVSKAFYSQIIKSVDPITSNPAKNALLLAIENQSNTPRSLVELCRFRIRDIIPSNHDFKGIVNSLDITEQCKEILMFERACLVSPTELESCITDEVLPNLQREWLVM